MKVSKVAVFGHIPAGTQVWLTAAQAASRRHLITEAETGKKLKDRKLFTADGQLGFKAGEELAIEGDLDRGLEMMFGIEAETPESDDKSSSRRGKADKTRAIANAEADLTAKQQALATAQQNAETIGADDAKSQAEKDAAQAEVGQAEEAVSAAEQLLAELKA